MTFDLFFEESGEAAPPPMLRSRVFRWRITADGKEFDHEKWCPGCEEWKPIGEFWVTTKAGSNRMRRYPRCRQCNKYERCIA